MGPTSAESAPGAATSAWASRAGGDLDEYLRGREHTENFPVALRVLPREHRTHLATVYDVARVIDDLGDEAPGDRVALLTAFRDDLERIWLDGEPRTPVLRRLAPTVRACSLSRQPFVDLVEANLVDQVTEVYPTYADLLAYCELSANPIGRTVLELFGASTPERVALSDRICTGLQIIEHCQDVAEDRRAGRIYLPLEDLDRFGVAPEDLDAAETTKQTRQLVEFEAQRAIDLLIAGSPLIGRLRGWARLAVSGYAAGGHAAFTSLKRTNWDVMAHCAKIRRTDVIGQLVVTLVRGKVGS
ncbi:MAG TPA: squalene synthase HpnC [Micromonosporaceae bacterium]